MQTKLNFCSRFLSETSCSLFIGKETRRGSNFTANLVLVTARFGETSRLRGINRKNG